MNCTLEDLIVKNLDRDSVSAAATAVRGIRPLVPKPTCPSTSAAAAADGATATALGANSPDTNETSPGDSDYESESNGIPLLKVRTPPAKVATPAAASTSSSVDFNQTIKKSIKDLFLK